MGKNRDRINIIADILMCTAKGAGKTRIMFRANLSFKLLEKYLGLVVRLGFVQEEDDNYSLTRAGQEFLEDYKNYNQHYANVQKMLESLGLERETLAMMCDGSKPNSPAWG